MNKLRVFYPIAAVLAFGACSGENNSLNLTNLNMINFENKDGSSKNHEDIDDVNCRIKENSLFGLSRTCKNRSSFIASISNSTVSSKKVSEDIEAAVATKPLGNCKIQEQSLFGLSRTCNNSESMSMSLFK